MASQAGAKPNKEAAGQTATTRSGSSPIHDEVARGDTNAQRSTNTAADANVGPNAGANAGKAMERQARKAPGKQGSARAGAQKTGAGKANDPDRSAIASLKADHRKAEQLFARFEKAGDEEKQTLIEEVCKALTLHTMLEEEIFYPACRDSLEEDDPLNEAQVEHDSAKLLIADLMNLREDDPFRDAKVKVLTEQVKHHVGEEESGKDSIFAKAQAQGVDTPELAQRLKRRRAELEQRDRLPGGEPVAINLQSMENQREEYEMASYQQRGKERDDQGRFARGGSGGRDGRNGSDDDRGSRRDGGSGRERDEDGRFTSSRNGGGLDRSRNDDDRDYGRGDGRNGGGRSGGGRGDDDGRGWYGDSRGHSEAARRGWEDRGSSRSSRDDDDDRRGYSSRGTSRDDDDDRGGRRQGGNGRGNGGGNDGRGWYGDSRGHSEAARRGWDNSDHGDSGWYGDSRGHSEAARRGWDNPDHGRSGWFGDSEGHSEASRRGWEDRGSGRSSRGRDDDDRGSSRFYRGRDDDDDDRGRGRSGGHGGWFGDSRGHSEAARRGWDNRN